jgi:nitroreductase
VPREEEGVMELVETIRRRQMIRRFDRRPVLRETIDRILDLARRAPTAGFAQGVDFLVLDTPEAVAAFWRLTEDPDHPNGEDLSHGPTVIVLPIADKRAYLARYSEPDKEPFGLDDEDRWPVKFWDIDAAMASMIALLAAVDEGLGGWFFGISVGERELLSHLGVPEGIRPVGVLGFGYRAPDVTPTGSGASRRRRPFEEQVHRNSW